jgi:predicted metal-dependent peptidase
MNPQAQEAEAILKIAARRMVRAYPFHAHLISLGRLVEESDIGTMGVTIRDGELLFLYSAPFVLGCDLEQLAGVLHHEVLHILLGHLFMGPDAYPNEDALTIAEEVTVNEFVPERLPGSPILLKHFPRLPLLEDTDTRYRRLDRRSSLRGRRHGGPGSTIDNHGAWKNARGEGQAAAAAVMSAVERAASMLTPEELASVPEDTHELIEAARRGSAAGRIQAEVTSAHTNTVPWQRVLRRFVGRQTVLQPSYLRPPRRFPHLVGVLPGNTRTPGPPRILAAIDTSGSITDALLTQIAGELAVVGASRDVVIVECDAKIQRVYAFRGELHDVRGRGGTDLRPPFERAMLARIRPDLVVYFTDGEGPAPIKGPRMPVLWCLTPGARAPAPWGQKVWMT